MTASAGAASLNRPAVARVLAALAFAIAMLVASAGHANAIESLREYAGIVIDAKSGEVLYEHEADARRYPASLAKVMTLYILFQELEAGNVGLEDRMMVSAHAAAAIPTKLGLKTGWTITVAEAMKSLVTISANDIARVIAEHIAGSESAFAARMTATARALGMSNTTYRNASGLPNAEQVTTARDQAILGVAIYQHFPQYYELFQTESFAYGGRTYDNHNRLLGSNGVDGIKTGYTRASGSNLLTAAHKSGHSIVVAAFGFDSGAARDRKVRDLVKTYLPKGRAGSILAAAEIAPPGRKGIMHLAVANPVAPKPYPAFRQPPAQTIRIAEAGATAGSDAVAAAAMVAGSSSATDESGRGGPPAGVVGAWVGETYALTTDALTQGEAVPTPTPVEGTGDKSAEPPEPGDTATRKAASTPSQPGWVVQIGAVPSREAARSLLDAAAGAVSPLQELRPYVERYEKAGGRVYYRARFGGFEAAGEATDMCRRLIATEFSCLALMS